MKRIASTLCCLAVLAGTMPLCAATGFRTTFTLELGELVAPQATSATRALGMTQMSDRMTSAFSGQITSATQDLWRSALWAAKLQQRSDDLTRRGIRKALAQYGKLPGDELARSAIETAYAVDAKAFRREMRGVADATTTPKHFAMAVLYLARSATEREFPRECRAWLRSLSRKFPNWKQNPILTMLHFDMTQGRFSRQRPPENAKTPDLAALFRGIAPGSPVIFSIQRPERSWQGIALVRRGDGKFLRESGGNLFHIGHLARSLSNLPGYITNGNTPQGIFTIRGLDVTLSKAIGQTPFVDTQIPVEASPAAFFHAPSLANAQWTMDLYAGLLPGDVGTTVSAEKPRGSTWRGWFPMYEAWFAGVAGRSEMLVHGTTVNHELYPGAPWYANTPTIGCLCAKEFWDPLTGRALWSDQLALARAYLSAAGSQASPADAPRAPGTGPHGFLVVVETPDIRRPVSLDEIVPAILRAELP